MNEGGKVLYCQHGFADSADNFVTNNKDGNKGDIEGDRDPHMGAFGLRLALEGYDTFFVNSRGNKYSLTHKSKQPSSTDFFDFDY